MDADNNIRLLLFAISYSRGGRPDLGEDALKEVSAPTLLIAGGDDEPVIGRIKMQ
jgi:hypothetical protein